LELGALSIRPKNSALKFQKFHVANGTVFSANFPVGCTSLVGQNRSIHSRTEISGNARQTGTGNRNLSNGTEIYDQTAPTEKKESTSNGAPSIPKIFLLDRNEPFSFGPKFPKFWSNGKRPWSSYRLVLLRHRMKNVTVPLNTAQHC